MGNITTNRLSSSVAAAQRLQLALNHRMEYTSCEAMEADVDLVVSLLEETRDVVWPKLEERARREVHLNTAASSDSEPSID